VKAIERVREWNPGTNICCYGLYAPLNETLLRGLGAQTILGGEFEEGLASLARRLDTGSNGRQHEPLVSLNRQQFLVPDRSDLPALSRYARLVAGGVEKQVGYTEASRGCKHLCRHCPVVPVYNGIFRVVQRDVVLEDIRRQVAAGAQHITFGDPDFFNGIRHALTLVEALHAEHPSVTYDATIKIEHLLQHREALAVLQRTGCLFVISAVESIDDAVLAKLDKGHTRAGFVEAVRITREAGLALSPTFIPFTPWTTWGGYRELLRLLVELELVENVSPIQLAIRLLIPAGSRLLELEEIRNLAGPFEARALAYPWAHAEPALDRLCVEIQELIKRDEKRGAGRAEIFQGIWRLAHGDAEARDFHLAARATIPYLTEPWYC
jgi:radical SAM superfamily enzyme YgiQ (UPF0313 family)